MQSALPSEVLTQQSSEWSESWRAHLFFLLIQTLTWTSFCHSRICVRAFLRCGSALRASDRPHLVLTFQIFRWKWTIMQPWGQEVLSWHRKQPCTGRGMRLLFDYSAPLSPHYSTVSNNTAISSACFAPQWFCLVLGLIVYLFLLLDLSGVCSQATKR